MRTIRLVFFGDPGMGKSSTINSILKAFRKEKNRYFEVYDDEGYVGTKKITRCKIFINLDSEFYYLELIEFPIPFNIPNSDTFSYKNCLEEIIPEFNKILQSGVTAFIYINSFKYPEGYDSTKRNIATMLTLIPKSLRKRIIIMPTGLGNYTNVKHINMFFEYWGYYLNGVINEEIEQEKWKETIKFNCFFIENYDTDENLDIVCVDFIRKIIAKWKHNNISYIELSIEKLSNHKYRSLMYDNFVSALEEFIDIKNKEKTYLNSIYT